MLNTKFLEMGVPTIDNLYIQCTFYKYTNTSMSYAFPNAHYALFPLKKLSEMTNSRVILLFSYFSLPY